ncbi:unnamed protein product [Agarophyton chilense]|eukprot:gb/GEZJ01006017.1/.p1 GENE.gb/GEZJ01006017.1/~~gb/GEZJ01006017.1/.p1  ORF type:complete len:408 (-),score=53.92 gb/GEZJ01006017.1/:251-1474(-)
MAVNNQKERKWGPSKVVTLALTTSGLPIIPSIYSPILEQSSLDNKSVRTLCLNRPNSLHALDTTMCETLYSRILQIAHSETKCVILKSTTPSRAFCAGGDVRKMCILAEKQQYEMMHEFLRIESRLVSLLGMGTSDVVSILDGVVMGGGAGLCVHGRFRVATENTVFAMPEVAIGFHPDVGASHFLSRLSPGLGTYLALTGASLKGEQVLSAGIATHFVPHNSIDGFLEAIQGCRIRSRRDIENLLHRFCRNRSPLTEDTQFLSSMAALFNLPSIEDVIKRLKEESSLVDSIHASFAADSLRTIQNRCPMSLKVAFESLKRGLSMELDDCLKMEFRLSIRLSRRADFARGVRAVLVSKSNRAQWSPAKLSDISDEDVSKLFRPLADIMLPDLDLSHDLDTLSRMARL